MAIHECALARVTGAMILNWIRGCGYGVAPAHAKERSAVAGRCDSRIPRNRVGQTRTARCMPHPRTGWKTLRPALEFHLVRPCRTRLPGSAVGQATQLTHSPQA